MEDTIGIANLETQFQKNVKDLDALEVMIDNMESKDQKTVLEDLDIVKNEFQEAVKEIQSFKRDTVECMKSLQSQISGIAQAVVTYQEAVDRGENGEKDLLEAQAALEKLADLNKVLGNATNFPAGESSEPSE